MNSRFLKLSLLAALLAAPLASALAVDHERGTVILPMILYGSPNLESPRLKEIERGRESVVLERVSGWVHIIATSPSSADPEELASASTGWVEEKGFVGASTPEGAQILFGEAMACEDEASRAHPRKGADLDAEHLYYRVFDLFPGSPLAGEALYRAADIQWQLDRADIFSRPSRHGEDSSVRPLINEEPMRMVRKKFPNTRWAELADYQMLDNKLCGDWAGSSRCPEKEATIYEGYADSHPASPKAAEALYNAAYRWAALLTLYPSEGRGDRVAEARRRAEAALLKLRAKDAAPEWNARAARLLFLLRQGVALPAGQPE